MRDRARQFARLKQTVQLVDFVPESLVVREQLHIENVDR